METNFRVKCKSMCRKAWPFQSNLCIELLESNFPSVICLPKVPTLVQIELKVQEVLTKGIGSKISEESAYLRLASLSSWVCPPRLGRPVSNLRIFFFPSWPFPPRLENWVADRQAGRRRWVLFKHAWSIPLPAPKSWTPRHPSPTPGGARAPARVHRGFLPPTVRAASSGTTSFYLLWRWLSFSIVFRWESFW